MRKIYFKQYYYMGGLRGVLTCCPYEALNTSPTIVGTAPCVRCSHFVGGLKSGDSIYCKADEGYSHRLSRYNDRSHMPRKFVLLEKKELIED
jgi:hypothetical protein